MRVVNEKIRYAHHNRSGTGVVLGVKDTSAPLADGSKFKHPYMYEVRSDNPEHRVMLIPEQSLSDYVES